MLIVTVIFKVQCNLDKATENEKLVVNTCREQSYDISPYKESDDENEEDDDSISNNKFIPSWARYDFQIVAVSW